MTGGAGFIGSNLVDALVAAGDAVTVVDDLSTGRAENLAAAVGAGAQLVRADVRDRDALDAAFAAAAPERVFHLAAQIDVRRSVADPAHDAAINVLGTVNVLEAAHRHGVRRVVNTSTGGAIYGVADVVPTPEGAPERPMAAYGTSKLCGEQYCGWFSRLHGLSTVTLRLANVYGPRQDPLGEAGVIALFCDRVLGGEDPTIYGDGRQTRDFVFVGDVVRAQLAAAERPADGAVNVGTGIETSVLELADAVAAAGREVGARGWTGPAFAAPRAGEIERSCLDVRRAADELGFQARTALVDGLTETLRWVQELRRTRIATA